jgi:hypothetical protein
MPGTVVANVEKVLHTGLNREILLYDTSVEYDEHMMLAGNKVETKEQYFEIAAYTGLDLPARTDEYGSIQATSQAEVFNFKFRNKKFMLKVNMSNEAYDDEQGKAIVKAYARDLKVVFHQATEIDAADTFLNLVTDATNNPGPNGEALAVSNHALKAGTYSNILSPAETASPDALRKLNAIQKKTKAHKGMLSIKLPPYIVFCSADDEVLWHEIWKSTGKAQENSNTTGEPYRKMIAGIVGSPYATNASRWGIRVANNAKHKGFHQVREEFKIVQVRYDDTNDSYVVTARKRFVNGWYDWRGFAYSLA